MATNATTAHPRTMDESEWMIKMAYLKALEQRAEELRRELKDTAPEEFTQGTATLPNGRPVGVVRRRAGYTRCKVADADAFRGWVAERHPDMLRMGVDTQFQRHLLQRARHETIPGTEATYIHPGYEVTLSEDAFDEFWLEQAANEDFAAMLDLS